MVRAFIMVDLSKGVKNYLFNMREKFSSKDAKITWTHKKILHQTLKFLGDVDEEKIEEVREKLKEVKFKKFEVGLSEVGYFPSMRNIKVLWVGLEPVNKIIELQHDVEDNLKDLFKKDNLFKPHITLGRVKNVKNKKRFLGVLDSLEVSNMRFNVNSFTLVKSVLSKDGPKYSVIEEYSGV